MIPVLSHTEEFQDLSIWTTTDGKCGIGFQIDPCDLETMSVNEYYQKLVEFLRQLNPNILGRIKLTSVKSEKVFGISKRSDAIVSLGHSCYSVQLSIEVESEPQFLKKIRNLLKIGVRSDNNLKSLLEAYQLVKSCGLHIAPLNDCELKKLFVVQQGSWKKCDSSIHTGSSRIGVIRLVKPANFPISENSFSDILQKLPKPYEIHVSFRKLSMARVKLELERKLKQSLSDNSINPTNSAIQNSTIEALESAVKDGAQFLEYELLVTLERASETELSNAMSVAINSLNTIGEFQIETFGAANSYLATLQGNDQHVTFRELDSILPLMFPLWVSGEARIVNPRESSLLLHRSDGSVFDFNLFNPRYSVYNAVVVGSSGKGKSVLTGLLTQSLLNDPKINIIKIDVGGSHSKECKLFGGQEYVLELNRPSGINPFEIVKDERVSDSDKISILSKFLTVLIKEQGESIISKDLRSQIELSVQEYLLLAKANSLQEFYESQINFPRRNILRRWVSGGVYENAFKELKHNTSNIEGRLRYYNFSQIFQASDPEFAQAGLAAVLAQFNFEALVNDRKRIVLICDETPFFIKTCFEFFKFSTANVRKFGHAVVLIAQLSTDLVIDADTGIIENSPQRFLFSVDGNVSNFQDRFNLKEENIEQIRKLRAIPGKYSEVLLQTGEASRKLKIEVTQEEYWSLTSSKVDQEKLQNLQAAVPGLSLKEAIKCLSRT